MKRAVMRVVSCISCVLCALCVLCVLCSCESQSAGGTVYLHRLTLDRDAGGYILHALVSGDVVLTDGYAVEADTEAGAESAVWVTYGGKTPTEPFEALLAEHGHLYTATLEAYEWGTGLSEADKAEVYLYLMDSPAWPLAAAAKAPGQYSRSELSA